MSEPASDVLEDVQRLIAALEAHPDRAVVEQVTALLRGIDAVHRVALTRLVAAIQGMAGEAFLNRLAADPAIRLLLMSYDLLAVDRRLLAEDALDAVRGHLHSHGVDVELLDVVGGEVFVELHGLDEARLDADAVRHDVEAALAAGLIGFQALTVGGRKPRPPNLIQLTTRTPHRPVYRTVFAACDVAIGALKPAEIDGHAILVANVDGELYAVANRCGESPLPLHFSRLAGAELTCSWHGCRYDVRSGHRVDGGQERLAVFPVAVEDGAVRVAVATEPVSGP